MSSSDLRLPRRSRIKQNRDFALIRTRGSRMSCGVLLLNWLALPSHAGSRLGVVTGRRIGNATVRNRARRLLRESFRLHQHDLARPVDLVMVARASIAGKDFAQVEGDVLAVLRRARLLRDSS